MRYFPLYYDMQDARVAVVGGGETALQKLRLLLKTPAAITVFADELHPDIQNLHKAGLLEWVKSLPSLARLEGFDLLYGAGDADMNTALVRMADELKIPVNVVDEPDLCSFITPAIVERGPLCVAIGTEGAAPVLAQKIKSKLEEMLPGDLGELVEAAAGLREEVARQIGSSAGRRRFWHWFFQNSFGCYNAKSQIANAQRLLGLNDVELSSRLKKEHGFVHLVGGGAGTSDFLTFKAARLLSQADAIVYDRLIDKSVLEVARRDAKMIYVGKAPGQTCLAQDAINKIMIDEALAGQVVVRLKCGDPLIFGRGGEEMKALEAAGIDFDVVPGVTAATACAAEAKLPLTEREGVRSLVYLTGHSTEGLTPYDWSAFAGAGTMLVIYMGVRMAAKIEANLLAVGASTNSRVVIVEDGGKQHSRQFEVRLGRLGALMKDEAIQHPAMIYVRVAVQRHDLEAESAVPRIIEDRVIGKN